VLDEDSYAEHRQLIYTFPLPQVDFHPWHAPSPKPTPIKTFHGIDIFTVPRLGMLISGHFSRTRMIDSKQEPTLNLPSEVTGSSNHCGRWPMSTHSLASTSRRGPLPDRIVEIGCEPHSAVRPIVGPGRTSPSIRRKSGVETPLTVFGLYVIFRAVYCSNWQ
jgi:hypothetical protein